MTYPGQRPQCPSLSPHVLLTLSSLGFFEHSQPGGEGVIPSTTPPPPTVPFLLLVQTKWNFAQLLTVVSSYILIV